MSKKAKWKNVPLNKTNIDAYMDDLYESTKGKQIIQGVSFNKDDDFQMNLLKNALISHGSFSGFIKHVLFVHFNNLGQMSEDIFKPKEPHIMREPIDTAHIPESNPVAPMNPVQLTAETEQIFKDEEEVISPSPAPAPQPKRVQRARRNGITNKSDFTVPKND